jgi:hypothetical protein
MRFPCLFGEVIPALPMPDDGVRLVYGCDEPPDPCKGFLEFVCS